MPEHDRSDLRKAYARATSKLRKAHEEEFADLLQAEYDAMGITVKRKLTGERKRRADMEKLRARLAELEGQAPKPTA